MTDIVQQLIFSTTDSVYQPQALTKYCIRNMRTEEVW